MTGSRAAGQVDSRAALRMADSWVARRVDMRMADSRAARKVRHIARRRAPHIARRAPHIARRAPHIPGNRAARKAGSREVAGSRGRSSKARLLLAPRQPPE